MKNSIIDQLILEDVAEKEQRVKAITSNTS